MARTIVMDSVFIKRLAVARSQSGQLEVACEYDLLAGGRPVASKFVTLDPQQATAFQASLLALFNGAAQQIAAVELT